MIREALLEITERCDLACVHCYAKKNTKDLALKDWFKIMAKLKAMGVEKVDIFGGEPTLFNGFYSLLDYAIENFKSVAVQTNGVTKSDFSNRNCTVSVSMEYPDAKKNDNIRRGIGGFTQPFADPDDPEQKCGQFKLALRKIVLTKNPKLLRYTIYRDSDPLKFAWFAENIGANSIGVPLKPVGSAANMREMVPTPSQMFQWYKDISVFADMSKMFHEIDEPQYYIANPALWSKHGNKFLKRGRACPAGIYRIFISSKGQVAPCSFLQQYNLGNLLRDRKEVVEKKINQFNKMISEMPLGGKCANCRLAPACGGGCIVHYIHDRIKMGINCPITPETAGKRSKQRIEEEELI